MIEEKTAVLQKRESEGFGFVLRGAKGRNRGTGSGVVGVWRKRRRDLKKKKKKLLAVFHDTYTVHRVWLPVEAESHSVD